MITEREWIKYLCEYYGVSHDEAIELGTRKTGRKPNLPASKTCNSVSDMTLEDIWEIKERKTQSDIFDFYIDQGAWSTFRQTVRHIELLSFHKSLWDFIGDLNYKHICEYGCGVAPFVTSLLLEADSELYVDVSLTDIENCEHLHFAEWKLNKIVEEKNMSNVEIDVCPVKVGALPDYAGELDLVIMYEVPEHVPSPVNTLNNLMTYMGDNSLLLENFINNPPLDDDDGPDLDSAAIERAQYYDILKTNFKVISGDQDTESNYTRLWQRQ